MRPFVLSVLLGIIAATRSGHADQPDTLPVVDQAIKAAGGREGLLSRFTIRETLNVSSDPDKLGNSRTSVFDGRKDWWFRSSEKEKWKKKKDEPAVDLVWAWTLQAFLDPATKVEAIIGPVEEGQTLDAVRISGTIDPPMDVYFDPSKHRLVRIDWRADINRFNDWKVTDGIAYPAKCIGYRKATGKQWYASEIVKIEKLEELPSDIPK